MKNLLNRLTRIMLIMLLLIGRTPFLDVYAGKNILIFDVDKFEVVGGFTIQNTWTIDKSADKSILNLPIGSSEDVGYTITVDKSNTAVFSLVFAFKVENKSINTETVSVSVNVEDPNGTLIYGPQVVQNGISILAGQTYLSGDRTISFSIPNFNESKITPFKVQLIVTSSSVPLEDVSGSLSAAINNIGTITYTNQTLTVTDSMPGVGPWSFTNDDVVNYTKSISSAMVGGTTTVTNTVTGISDTTNISDSVSITVNTLNATPIANNQTLNILEETPTSITLSGSDTDGSQIISYVNVGTPSNGVLSGTAPNLTYTPTANFYGTDSFTFRVFDGFEYSSYATITINVGNVDDLPVAVDDSGSTLEEVEVDINVLGNDTDVDGGLKEVISVGTPSNGFAAENLNGTIKYTPNANFVGVDTFTYTITGGSTATVTVTVNPVDDAPVAVNDAASTPEDTLVDIDVLANDTDVDGGLKEVTSVGVPAHGTAVENLDGTIRYTPALNYFGPDEFTYTINGGSSAIVYITVNSVNDLPIANPDTFSTNEDTPLDEAAPGVLVNDLDVENNGLLVSIVLGLEPIHGTLTLNPNGSFLYTPTANYFGSDSFTYRITDGDGGTATALATINVLSEEDNPIANPGSFSVNEGGTYNGAVTGTDDDGNTLSFELVNSPVNGTIDLNGLGEFEYIHNGSETISDSFTFRVSDDGGLTFSLSATVSITVIPVNDPPVATPQSVSTPEDTPLPIMLSGTDAESTISIFGILSAPSHGTLSGTGANRTYTPAANYNGPDSFTFGISDGFYRSYATVTIDVTPVNDMPIATPQDLNTPEDTALPIELSGIDVEGPISLFGVTVQPLHGTLSGTAPNLTYTPALNYNGPDSFTFAISDGFYRDSAVVTINVTPVNDAPEATPQSVSTPEDTPLPIVLSGTDVEGVITLFGIVSAPSHGTLSGTGVNRTYTPAANYNGPDSFTFGISDGFFRSYATVTIDVTPVNDPPVATPQTLSTAEDTALPITLAGTDVETTPITLFGVTVQPTNGILSGTAPNIIYTPNANFVGSDSFTFAVSDGFFRDTAVVTIDVTPVNDPPLANPDEVTTPEDVALTIELTATDVEGPVTLFGILSFPSNGTLSGLGSTRIYTPDPDFFGEDEFTFGVSDGFYRSYATVTITVTPVDDDPVAVDDPNVIVEVEVEPFETPEDTPYVFDIDTLLANDYDPDDFTFGQIQLLAIANSFDFNEYFTPSVGSLALDIDLRTLTYTPPLNYVGPVTFEYNIMDTEGNISDPAVVTLTVTPVNDAPVANPLAFTVANAGTSSGSVTATDVDLPADTLTYSLLTPATNGTATVGPTGTYTYTHNGTGTLVDSFVFSVTDGTLSSTATVTVTVLAAPTPPPPPPANLAPSATPIAITVANAGTSTGTLSGSDPEGAPLSFTLVGAPANGTVVISPAGAYSYTHNGTTTVTDSFTFAVSDGSLSATATVSVTILPIPAPGNTPPVVVDGVDDGPFGAVIEGTLLPLGSDADGDPLTFSVLVGPTNGTLVLNPDGTFTYTPDTDFAGVDSFTFIANDGTDDSNEGTFTLDVLEEVVIITEPETPLAAVNNDWLWWLLALLAGLLLWLLAFLRPNMKYTLTDNENNQKVVRRRLAKPDENTMLVELSDKDMLNIQTIDVEFYKRLAKHLGNVTINFQLNGKVIHSVTLPEGIKDSFETLIRL